MEPRSRNYSECVWVCARARTPWCACSVDWRVTECVTVAPQTHADKLENNVLPSPIHRGVPATTKTNHPHTKSCIKLWSVFLQTYSSTLSNRGRSVYLSPDYLYLLLCVCLCASAPVDKWYLLEASHTADSYKNARPRLRRKICFQPFYRGEMLIVWFISLSGDHRPVVEKYRLHLPLPMYSYSTNPLYEPIYY